MQTHVNAEAKAAANLDAQGFAVYLPRYLKRRSHARKVDMVARPCFPAIFSSHRYRKAEMARYPVDVRRLASCLLNGWPASVEDSVIDALKAREDEGGFSSLLVVPVFRLERKVRIFEGAFIDNLALVEGVSDHERVAVLLDLLGRKVRVLVGADLIAAA